MNVISICGLVIAIAGITFGFVAAFLVVTSRIRISRFLEFINIGGLAFFLGMVTYAAGAAIL